MQLSSLLFFYPVQYWYYRRNSRFWVLMVVTSIFLYHFLYMTGFLHMSTVMGLRSSLFSDTWIRSLSDIRFFIVNFLRLLILYRFAFPCIFFLQIFFTEYEFFHAFLLLARAKSSSCRFLIVFIIFLYRNANKCFVSTPS